MVLGYREMTQANHLREGRQLAGSWIQGDDSSKPPLREGDSWLVLEYREMTPSKQTLRVADREVTPQTEPPREVS